jgi:hypothetical protein
LGLFSGDEPSFDVDQRRFLKLANALLPRNVNPPCSSEKAFKEEFCLTRIP